MIYDLRLEKKTRLELLIWIKSQFTPTEIIIIKSFFGQKTAIADSIAGTFDYLITPFQMDEQVLRIKRIFQQKKLQEDNMSLHSLAGE